MTNLSKAQYSFWSLNIGTLISDYRHVFSIHDEVLRTTLECQYGLVDHLMERDVLPYEQLRVVRGLQWNRFKQNSTLLEMLNTGMVTDVQRFEEFLDALRKTHQFHLADLLAGGV